jgi:hypothetical protein
LDELHIGKSREQIGYVAFPVLWTTEKLVECAQISFVDCLGSAPNDVLVFFG